MHISKIGYEDNIVFIIYFLLHLSKYCQIPKNEKNEGKDFKHFFLNL